jgi:hypothetical protein
MGVKDVATDHADGEQPNQQHLGEPCRTVGSLDVPVDTALIWYAPRGRQWRPCVQAATFQCEQVPVIACASARHPLQSHKVPGIFAVSFAAERALHLEPEPIAKWVIPQSLTHLHFATSISDSCWAPCEKRVTWCIGHGMALRVVWEHNVAWRVDLEHDVA